MSTSPGDEPVPRPEDPGEDHDDGHRLRMVVAWRRSVRLDARATPRRRRLDVGMLGSGLLGCLVAAGLTWLLITVVAGVSVVLGLAPVPARSAQAAGATGAVAAMTRSALLGCVLLAPLAGGYAAARMSRRGGPLLGFVVWVWMQLVALVVVSLGAVTNAAGGLPDATARRSEDLVDWNLGAVGPLMIIAMALAAMVGTVGGAVLGSAAYRRGQAQDADGDVARP